MANVNVLKNGLRRVKCGSSRCRPICPLKWFSDWTKQFPLNYIRVRAAVWAFGRGQTDTDTRDHNTFCVVYDSRKM